MDLVSLVECLRDSKRTPKGSGRKALIPVTFVDSIMKQVMEPWSLWFATIGLLGIWHTLPSIDGIFWRYKNA